MKKTLTILFLAAISCTVQAQSYFRDSTFNAVGYNDSGYVYNNGEYIKAIQVTPDSEILAIGDGGNAFSNQTYHMLFKYNPCTGKLDSTFGINGISETHWDFYSDMYDAAIQPDGKILIAGDMNVSNGGGAFRCSITRYNADGSVDTTFNHTGNRAEQFTNNSDFFYKIFIQPDGKILCAGQGNFCFQSMRLNPDGSLDSTYGNYSPGRSRVCPVNIGSSGDAFMDANGEITMLQNNYSANTMVLCRLDSTGQVDTTFGNVAQGVYQTTINEQWLYNDSRSKIYPVANNKMIVTGTITFNEFMVYRLNWDGSVDSTYGTNGYDSIALAPFSIGDHLCGKVLPSGKIFTWAGGSYNVEIARFNTDGTIDSTFGTNGLLLQQNHEDIMSATELPAGRLMIANLYYFSVAGRMSRYTQTSYVPRATVNGVQVNVTGINTSIQWYYNGSLLPNDTTASFTATQNGSYYAVLADPNGCTRTSDTVMVISTGIHQVNTPAFSVYPVPAGDFVTVQFSQPLQQNSTIEISDARGAMVYADKIKSNTSAKAVDVSRLSQGVYFITVRNEKEISVSRFEK